jgi:ABC-type uncharacterized transport system involved in gliding motility auxiliary subunit
MKNKYSLTLIITNLALYITGSFLIVALPESQLLIIGTFVAAFLATLGLIFVHRDDVKNFMNSSYGKKVASNIISYFLVFCILGLVNYIALKRPIVWDLGKRKLNSLTDQSRKVVDSLKSPIKFLIFAQKNQKVIIENLVKLYTNDSGLIDHEFIDPQLRPDLVAKYGITRAPSIVVLNGEKSAVVARMQELAITNGIIKSSRDKDPVVCFSNNPLFTDSSELGYTALLNITKQTSLSIRVVDLLKVPRVPADCNLFALISPRQDLLPENLEKIKFYVKEGGRFLLTTETMFNGDKIPSLRSYLRDQGLVVSNDLVIDQQSHVSGSQGAAPIVKSFDPYGINNPAMGQVFFPVAISVAKAAQDIEFIPLATTTEKSWSERTLGEITEGKVKFDEKDQIGPVAIGGALLESNRPKIIVIGNSSFLSNKFHKFQTNFNYFLNITHWAVGQDLLTSLQAAVFTENVLFIGATHKRVIFYFSIIIMPIIFLLTSVFFYRKRRMS